VVRSDARGADRPEQEWTLLFTAWLIAAAATAGSLFFSQVMEFAPCELCWYQRICLFPLVLILARGLFPLDRGVVRYALPLAGLGAAIAAYHVLVYEGVIPESLRPCARGVSCREVYIELFGFISIPLMALLAFAAITGLLVVSRRIRA
jgi:disulfide bond formation protein DsbB